MTLQSDQLSRACRTIAGLCLAATAVALAVVPDELFLRTKVTWARAGLLTSASLLLLAQGLGGQLIGRWPRFVGLACLPAVWAGLHWAFVSDVISPLHARDEIERLALLPLGVWCGGMLADGPERRRRLIFCLAIAGIFVGGWALLQNLSEQVGLHGLGIRHQGRSEAGFGNPVFLGAWLVMVTPLLLAEALTEPSAWRWPSAVGAGLCLPALLTTDSAGAWLGFGMAIVVAMVLLVPNSRVLTSTLVGAALAAAALLLMHPNILRQRTHGLIWRDSLTMALDNPWGVGPGQFPLAFLPYASEELLAEHPRAQVIINDAHNESLQVLAELGWPGLLLLLAAVFLLLRRLRGVLGEAADRAPDAYRLLACVAAVAGSLSMSFVSPDLRFTATVIQLALLLGILASYAPEVGRGIPAGKLGRLALLAVALAGLGGTAWSTHARLSLGRLMPEAPAPSQADLDRRGADIIRISKLRRDALDWPDDPQVQYELGRGLALVGNWSAAADAFQDALDLSPDNASVVEALGMMLSLAGRHAEALPHLRATLEARPEHLTVRYQLALSAFFVGEIREATEQVQRVLAEDPQHVQARRLNQYLRQ